LQHLKDRGLICERILQHILDHPKKYEKKINIMYLLMEWGCGGLKLENIWLEVRPHRKGAARSVQMIEANIFQYGHM